MNDELHESRTYRYAKNRFVMMIIATVLVSFVLVAVALGLYASSGAAQVDLSRPGYSSVRSQVKENGDDFVAFPSDGPITKDVLNQFESEYGKTTKNITSVDAFDPGVLGDTSLRISGQAD